MKAIVTIVVKDMPKGKPKETGIDIFGRLSTDVLSIHKCFLFEGESIKDITEKALNTISGNIRISRIEVLE